MVSVVLSLVFLTGCGMKTDPVYSDKQSVNSAEEGKGNE